MKLIQSISAFLKGKKSYIVAGLMVALGLLNDDQALLLQGLAVFSLRNAL